MAESTLTVTYADLQEDVAIFLGWNRTAASWTTANNSDFLRILESGLRSFYFPVISEDEPTYEWQFVQTEGTITLATADSDYDLPDNFSGVILDDSVTNAVDSERRPLSKVSETVLRKYRSMNEKTGVPEFFAVRPKTFVATTGQRWEMLVYPQPTSNENLQVLTFRYVWIPEVLTSTNLYHVGGGRYSEVLRASVLASAETILDDDSAGPLNQRFNSLLQAAIRADKTAKANDRGGAA